MSTPQLAREQSRWSDDVIRRVVRAWAAGYGIDLREFADGIGMPVRTLMRRLAGTGPRQAFTGGEIAQMANYMSCISGDKVSIEDLYSGHISVWGAMPDHGPEWAPSGSNRRPTD